MLNFIRKLLKQPQMDSVDVSKVSYVSIDEFIISLSRRLADVESRVHSLELENKDLIDKVLRKIQKKHTPQSLRIGSTYHKM